MAGMTDADNESFPKHIAIIMDGNGRWAKKQGLPRAAGHKAGIKTLRKIVKSCAAEKIQALTVYAFSSENWRRPEQEVGILMELFVMALKDEVKELHENQVNIRFIGDSSRFPVKLQNSINSAKLLTAENTGLKLRVAANYGGQWDITQASKNIASAVHAGEIKIDEINEELFASYLSMSELPDPDLFIRTGGEQRISNYLLWQLAYTEMYFTDTFWPDFSPELLHEACAWYAGRQRRFGRVSEQIAR